MSTPLYRSRPGGFDIQPASEPEALRVNDFIYMSPGLSNSFLVVTPAGRVVINTGMGFEAPVHKRNYDAVDASPVRYILLTQAHVDHVGGVDLLREEGTEIVARTGNVGYQAEDNLLRRARASRSHFAFAAAIEKAAFFGRTNSGLAKTNSGVAKANPGFAKASSGLAKANPGLAKTDPRPTPVQSAPEPTITFDEHFEFELGGLRFELLATPGGETEESMVVWLPDHRICFCGNVFGALFGHIPNLVTIRGDRYRDALVVIDTIERVLALEPELLLVGHGAAIEGRDVIQSELTRLRDAVRYVHDETVRYMNEGKDIATAMREIALPPELEVGEGYGKVSWCVRAIWENYLGWFHHRSTTELYAVAPGHVDAQLVELAGGPDALAKRARERLDAGAPLEAIGLVEVALAAAPAHRDALEVSLAAHDVLASETENFWLLSWLRDQMRKLRAALPD